MARNADLWGGLVWLAFGLFAVWGGHDLGLGKLNDPGSGFLIFWAGVLISAFALVVVKQALTGTERRSVLSLWAGTRWINVLLVVISLVLFAAAFEQLGFVVCILPLLIALMRFVDPVRWRTTLLVSGIATGAVWYVMTKLLLIQLPAGLLWDRLGLL